MTSLPNDPPQRVFDLVVIGGGIAGAGVARDAALRGLSCLLVDKGDFSGGTSSKTSRLIHGGLSYLECGDLQLSLETLHERELLVRMAPHLVRRIPVMLPIYRGDRRSLWKVRAGFTLYEALSLGRGTQSHDVLSAAAARRCTPFLREQGLRGAGLIQEYQLSFPERLVLENVLSAREHGAQCLSYHEAVALTDAPDGIAVELEGPSGDRQRCLGRAVVNAAGPWVDRVAARYLPGLAPKVSPVKGTHLAVRGGARHAVFAHWRRDQRLFFTLPLGDHALVGLARQERWEGDPDCVAPDLADVDALVEGLHDLVPGWDAAAQGVSWAYAGLHPLAVGRRGEASTSRRHRMHREGPTRRFFTIVGGSFTTYRRAAEETVDEVCRLLRHDIPSSTDRVPFFGGGLQDRVLFRESLCECTQALPCLPRETLDHLVGLYGRRCCEVIETAVEREPWQHPVAPGYRDLAGQVVYAARHEAVRHLDDVILRRLRMGLTRDRGLAGAEAVSRLLAAELGWSEATRREEVERFQGRVAPELAAALPR